MSEEDQALLEDSDFMFIHNESVFNQPNRLGVSAQKMQDLWMQVGNYMRAAAFNLVVQEQSVRATA